MVESNRFPKELRLLSTADFDYLKINSKSFKNKALKAYFKKSRISNSENTRIGIAVSKKVGKAYVRNRLKRLIRDYFRQSKYKLTGLDILITVSPYHFKKAEEYDEAEMYFKQSLGHLFKGIKRTQESL